MEWPQALDCLQVLEANDNKHFIDNSDFTSRKAISPSNFIDHVFKTEEEFLSLSYEATERTSKGSSYRDKKRLYLRTLSMPDALFKDIATTNQIKSLRDKIFFTGSRQTDSIDEFANKVFRRDTMQLWVGTRGNITPLHYDRNHGLLVQILGEKSVILFSHEDSRALYPFPSHSPKSHLSRINFRKVEDEAELLHFFPKFSRAQPYSCVISPGDILYIPPFWWHDVTSQDDCVSVTLPWDLNATDEIPPCVLR